jgi:maltose/moltooligosaccharide transporter
MPKVMWQLALVYLFSGMPYSAIGKTPQEYCFIRLECYPKSNPAYEEAVGWTGLVNGWYNIVTFLTAFALVGFARNLVQSTCMHSVFF